MYDNFKSFKENESTTKLFEIQLKIWNIKWLVLFGKAFWFKNQVFHFNIFFVCILPNVSFMIKIFQNFVYLYKICLWLVENRDSRPKAVLIMLWFGKACLAILTDSI